MFRRSPFDAVRVLVVPTLLCACAASTSPARAPESPRPVSAADDGVSGVAVAAGGPAAGLAEAPRAAGGRPLSRQNVPEERSSAPGETSRSVAAAEAPAQRALALADAALQREDYAAAVQQYREARRLAPEDPAPLVGLVQARIGAWQIPTEYAGAVDESRLGSLFELLSQAERLDPSFGPLHLQRGRLWLMKGQPQAARAELELALDRLPRDAEAHSALAVANLALGDKGAALEGFRRAAELEPNTPERQANLGTALMMHGDVRQAITAYRRAVQFAPNDARAHGDLGTALLAGHDVDGAMPHLMKAHQLAPERATFMSNLGYAHQLRGELEQAVHWYQRAIERDKRLNSAWINLATARAQQRRFDEARRALDEAERIDPSDPRIPANRQELEQMIAEEQGQR